VDDAVVVGSGPNGLAAAIAIARTGRSVRVLEARRTIGGGIRTEALTLPGFAHDVCSGCHPMGVLSPFFRALPLAAHGLTWVHPPASVAHPLEGQPAVLLRRSTAETARDLGEDGRAWQRLFAPFLHDPHALLTDLLAPLRPPRHPIRMARFGLQGLLPATTLFRARFRGQRARALMAGCAMEYKKTEENLNKPPINCFTAEGDIRVLQSEKASVAQQMAAGLQTIVPTSIVVGLITGTSGTSAQVENGEYNRMIDARIAEIKSVCGMP